jgi:hypothetical protein
MLTFDEAWKQLDPNEQPAILLGNGFSRAWNTDIFSYASLLEIASFGIREETIRELFKRIDTFDFESVMRTLLSSQLVLETYKAEQDLIKAIVEDQETLKNALLAAVSKSHPRLPTEITNNQYEAVRKFLSLFSQIFTVNYDLLMYWARNNNDKPPKGWIGDDGFRAGGLWKGYGTGQNVHFLHGALHIFESVGGVQKHTYCSNGESIIDQVKANLTKNSFPLFVSEPTHQKKKQRIDKSPYLTYCLRALQEINGTVFIYGHSLDENDRHIFDSVASSEVSKVFVSIFGDEHSAASKRVKANALAYFEKANRRIEFFDASSVKIWS